MKAQKPYSADETIVSLMDGRVTDAREVTVLDRRGVAERGSLAEIWEEAAHVAAGLLDRGFEPGDRIGVIGSTSLAYITSCLAVWRAGLTLVPLPGHGRNVTKEEWSRVAGARINTAGVKLVVGISGAELGVRELATADLRRSAPATRPPSPDDVAMIQFSSGTTSRPKGSVLHHRTCVARLRLRGRVTTVPDDEEHTLRWNQLHTGAGMTTSVVQPFARGTSLTLLPSRLFTADPLRWLKEIEQRGITHTGGPTFAYDMASRVIQKGIGMPVDLSGWRVASASAEVIDPAALVRFSALAAPLGFKETAFQTRYISSEAGYVTDGREGMGLRIQNLDRARLSEGFAHEVPEGGASTAVLCNGAVIDGVRIRIADGSGEELPEGSVGEIWIDSPGLAAGYLDAADLTSAAFEGSWYRSGDAGYLDGGELFITGRVKDMMIVRGANLYSEDVEAVVQRTVKDCICCAFSVRVGASEEIVLVLEPQNDVNRAEVIEGARAAVWRALGVSVKDVVVVDQLPRTDSGKLQRRRARALYEGDQLEVSL